MSPRGALACVITVASAAGSAGCLDVLGADFAGAHQEAPAPARQPQPSRDLSARCLPLAATSDTFDIPCDVHQGTLVSSQLVPAAEFIAIGSQDEIYAVGILTGKVKVGRFWIESHGEQDVFAVRISSTGVVEWAKAYGSPGEEHPYGIALTPDGDVLVAGDLAATGGLTIDGVPAAQGDAGGEGFLLALDGGTGEALWARGVGGTGDKQLALGVGVDPKTRRIALTGTFECSLQLGDADTEISSSSCAKSAFLALLDTDGTHLWSQSFGGNDTRDQLPRRAFFDDDGAIFLSGTANAPLVVDGEVVIVPQLDASHGTAFLTKFSSAGGLAWALPLGLCEPWWWPSAILLSGGDLVVSTAFKETLEIAGRRFQSTDDERDLLLARVRADGSVSWVRHFGSPGVDKMPLIARGTDDTVFLNTTYITGGIDFGLGEHPSPTGAKDTALAKFTADGDVLFSRVFSCNGAQDSDDIGTRSDGSVVSLIAQDDKGCTYAGTTTLAGEGSALVVHAP